MSSSTLRVFLDSLQDQGLTPPLNDCISDLTQDHTPDRQARDGCDLLHLPLSRVGHLHHPHGELPARGAPIFNPLQYAFY